MQVEKLVGSDSASDTAAAYAQLQSFFSLIQGVGSLTFGYVLDRYGVRVGFAINFFGCALTYYMRSITTTLNGLWLSKVPGVTMAGFLCAQCAISRLTPDGTERVKALGRLTTAYTIGGVTGPYLGGILGSQGDYLFPAQIAAVGSLVAAALVFTLPAQLDDAGKGEMSKEVAAAKAKDAEAQVTYTDKAKAVIKVAGMLLFVKVASGVANSMADSARPLILKELSFDEKDMGTFMSAQVR
jgi:MFS family permease